MSNKYTDLSAVMQVIGCVFKNPNLLDFTDKYVITDEDFTDNFHRIIFGSIYKLHELGAASITLQSINDFLSSRPKHEAIYKAQKGDEWILKVVDDCLPTAFDFYYNRLKKMSLLRAYDSCGIDVSDIYDPDNILDTKKKQLQEEFIDNSTLEEIALKVDNKIDAIKMQYVHDSFGEAYQAGEGIFDLLENFKKHPEVGIPMYGPLINTITRGARLRKFYLRSAATGLGKAIPNYTMIPTPDGWTAVGDIHPGDILYGQDGKPTTVLQIHPQTDKKIIYEIEFSDGRIAECCEDHLWEYRYETHRGHAYRVESVSQILERIKTLKNGLKDSTNKGYRFHIKLNEAVQYPEKNYTVHPYVMGALLGDGSFRYNSTNKSLTFSSSSEELPNRIANLMGEEIISTKSSDYNFSYVFRNKTNLSHPLWVEEILKSYPELWNAKSENKFIPEDYLLGSVEQRWQLFQGLMDTDGSIDIKGRTSFFTISSKLRDNIIELCRSLGMVATYLVDRREDQYTVGEGYIIDIQCKKELKPKMFKLEKKLERAIAYANSSKRSEHKDHLAIVDIRKTERLVNMTCFTVSNEDHLFLMSDYIVTHNTRTLVADACNFACNRIYDDNFGWISNGTKEPTLFIATEQDLQEIQTLMLAFISSVDEEHILNNKYEGDEEERVLEAARIIADSPLYVETLPDFSLRDIEDRIKKNIRDHDVRYVVMDYIHTSLKILEEITKRSGGVKLREDNVLFMLSTRLKDICNQYGIFVISATQLNGDYVESETPDQNLLRGAKAIADSDKFVKFNLFRKKI